MEVKGIERVLGVLLLIQVSCGAWECPCRCNFDLTTLALTISCSNSSETSYEALTLINQNASETTIVRKFDEDEIPINETLTSLIIEGWEEEEIDASTLLSFSTRSLTIHNSRFDPMSLGGSRVIAEGREVLESLWISGSSPVGAIPMGGKYGPVGGGRLLSLRRLESLVICDSSPHLAAFFLSALPPLLSVEIERCQVPGISAASFASLFKLQNLSLAHNDLQEFPYRTAGNLWNLLQLDLSFNSLTHLQEGIFFGLFSLTHLNVSHNRVNYVDSDVFTHLPLLVSLDLSHNEVIQFFEPYFISNSKLSFVSMTHTWAPSLFTNRDTSGRSALEMDLLLDSLAHTSIKDLDISYNGMRILPEPLAHLPTLTSLGAHGNKWECSCGDAWIPHWLSSIPLEFKRDTLCSKGSSRRLPILQTVKELNCTVKNLVGKSPRNYFAKVGSGKLLDCHPAGHPFPKIYWLTPRKRQLTQVRDEDEELANYEVKDDGRLFIDKVTRKDFGVYFCTAAYENLNVTHYVHLGIDTSIFRDIRLMSIFVGWATSFSFLSLVLFVQFIRAILNRLGVGWIRPAYKARRLRTFFESFEQHKSTQLDWLRDNYNSQAKRIKDNCYYQVERIRESYSFQTKNLSDIREYGTQQLHTLRDQYHDQIRRVSSYSTNQLCRVRENYLFQRNRVSKFSNHQLLRLRETYKWQAATLNKILENLPRTLNFDTCRGMGVCGRSDSIYLDEFGESDHSHDPLALNDSSLEKLENVSLLIPPEFMDSFLHQSSFPIHLLPSFLPPPLPEDEEEEEAFESAEEDNEDEIEAQRDKDFYYTPKKTPGSSHRVEIEEDEEMACSSTQVETIIMLDSASGTSNSNPHCIMNC